VRKQKEEKEGWKKEKMRRWTDTADEDRVSERFSVLCF